MAGNGLIEISGVAWSGNGKVAAVDISLDGGRNWQTADLQGPVLPKALTRFGLRAQWNGDPWLLQSRCVDETGYVQPTIQQLRVARGTNSRYHNNAIVTWRVSPNGQVDHVQAV